MLSYEAATAFGFLPKTNRTRFPDALTNLTWDPKGHDDPLLRVRHHPMLHFVMSGAASAQAPPLSILPHFLSKVWNCYVRALTLT